MEPLMHYCLIKPSAFRDLMTFVGTNAIHQLRVHTEPSYQDFLVGDSTPTSPNPRPLTRGQKETRLFGLVAPVNGSNDFVAALRLLDDESYRTTTKDYRNLNSHSIGPRLALGMTRMVTRRVVPATRMETQPDGSGRLVTIPDRFVPSYSFGGLDPLDPEVARHANLQQYERARDCFECFTALLVAHCAKLPRTNA